jgi:hypothetical protein
MKDIRKLVRKLVEESYGPLGSSPYSTNTAIQRNINLIHASENLSTSAKSKRRFIWAGLLATLGAGVLAVDFLYGGPIRNILYPRNSTRGQQMTSLTELLTETSSVLSSTSSQLYSFSGRLFFDCGTSQFGTAGNGIQDDTESEPGQQGIKVIFTNLGTRAVETVSTDSSGDFKIDLPAGSYFMEVPNTDKFSYMCRSVNEFVKLPGGYQIEVGENNPKMSIGLMQGFLSFPEKGIDPLAGYYDRDPGGTLAWNGTDECKKNDAGTHFLAEEGDIIPSFMPGIVRGVYSNTPDNWVCIQAENSPFRIGFAHNSEVLVYLGAKVSRYDPVAKAGHRGYATHTLVHLQLALENEILDPYKPVYPFDLVPYGYWTANCGSTDCLNASWVPLSPSDTINWQNYWIVEDQTQYDPPYT